MFKWLRIQQLVLVETAHISFRPGLNIISGETGSGKSAVITTLSLIFGERADRSKIRKGEEKAIVEAAFDITHICELSSFLHSSGIDHELEEDLFIRREIFASGKSRSFVNHQPVQLAILQKIGSYLGKFIGQHANQLLFDLTYQRMLLDQYADSLSLKSEFAKSWQKQKTLSSQIEDLKASEAKQLRDTEICKMEIQEIQEADVKENEEQELFEEYTKLSHADEITHYGRQVIDTLSGEQQSILSFMSRIRISLQKLASLDPKLDPCSQQFAQAQIELQDVSQHLEHYLANCESNPNKMLKINSRLQSIEKLKKKYGPTYSHIQTYLNNSLGQLNELQNTDQKIEERQRELERIEASTNELALRLTHSREIAAKKMQKELTLRLQELNMPNSEVHIQVSPEARTLDGEDRVEFFMMPNRGESPISVKDCASGGELSRLMLSLQVLLTGKEEIGTVVFDEIDANIGGKTADDVGRKLKQIGEEHQVLCITHFPQVALWADHHIQISKQERQDRTFTTIQILDQSSQAQELARMAGKLL